MNSPARILVVDDEAAIADLVARVLSDEGFEVEAFQSAPDALTAFHNGAFDLAILDVMMPQMDGFELCAKLRATSNIPILFLSAKAEENDQVVGFALGADDYIPKPFRPRELVARVRARLRRASAISMPNGTDELRCGDLVIDEIHHEATLFDEPLDLTPTEFSLLALLATHAGQPLSSRSLFEALWHEPADASSASTVMVHIRNLRRKLAAVDSSKTYIENIWGVGYALKSSR